MPDATGGVSHLERLLPALERLCGARLRVWRQGPDGPRVVAGTAPAWRAGLGSASESVRLETPDGAAWFDRVPGPDGVWIETGNGASRRGGDAERRAVVQIVGSLLATERETAQVAAELSERYEEIDLLYTISEILGHTIRLEEAAERIVAEVSTVVRARRATLLVLDEERRCLRLVASRGMDAGDVGPIELDDPCSVAARAFREGRIIGYDPGDASNPGCPEGRSYRGRAFLSVPVLYSESGGPSRPIGVINLTDRDGEDVFSAGDRKLIAAIANQIGAAIANARLMARDLGQQQMRRELELARDLQQKLLPSPLVVAARADVAARCRQAASVGGDFYNLLNLPGDRIGVMIGDVTSHGFSAALIMALVMAATGLRIESAGSPGEALEQLEQSLAEELARVEMFLTAFYAVIDPRAETLAYANAGHPHAFVVDLANAEVARLEATRPPLGVPAPAAVTETRRWRRKKSLLCLFTDGLVEAASNTGERFGEARLLGHVRALRERPAREILEAIFAELAAFTDGAPASDDRTLVLLRV